MGDGFLSGAAIQFLLGEGEIRRDFEVTADVCSDAKVELAHFEVVFDGPPPLTVRRA